MPFVAAKSPPAGQSWWIFEEDVLAVVCVVVSQRREGSLERVRACSWEVDAQNVHGLGPDAGWRDWVRSMILSISSTRTGLFMLS